MTRTPTDSVDVIRGALARVNGSNPLVERLLTELDALEQSTPTGTVRAWMEGRHGHRVDTVQVNALGAWAPLARVVDASHATYALLGGSRRDYRGLRVLAVTDTALLAESENTHVMYVDTDTNAAV